MVIKTEQKVLFSWNNGTLVLQARKPGDSRRLHLIPRSNLRGDFPVDLIDKYVHWLDLSTGVLEFRPVGSLWTPETSNWQLYIRRPGIHPRAVLQKPNQGISLIDIRSRTFGMVSNLVSSLESPKYIVATYTAQVLDVSLPRFHLSFFVNTNSELECRNMPGYVIDESQTCGTMFGLENMLFLRPTRTSAEDSLLPRRVIIPQGEISFRKKGDFTSVSINTDDEQHVRWHEYTIDTDLGCLTSNASLCSKLYQCYLHALTSHCLPDPLLGHTGTEEALYILRSASCRSFQRLDIHEARLLELISSLTPERIYYPSHLQSMATVKWNDLPALSQHHGFFQTACSIFDHARALEVMYDPPAVFETSNRNPSLLCRAASRNKPYYPSDLQISERPSFPNDVIHRSRDLSDLGTAEHVAFQTSWSVWNGQPSLDAGSPNLWDVMKSWHSLGPPDSSFSLRYSQYWLEFDAARDWFMIYELCRKAINSTGLRNSKIEMCFSLSAAAYSKSKYSALAPFLVIFSLDQRFCDINPPADRSYALSHGLTPGITHLEKIVSESALPLKSTPANSLPGKMKRKKAEYGAAIKKESSRVAESVLRRWPGYQHVDLPEEWFSKSDFNRRIKEYDQSISWNIRLMLHASQLQNVLSDWKNPNVLITTPVPYVFSPQFTTSNTKPPPYSLHDIFVSRANISTPPADGDPLRFCAIPDTATAEPLASSDSLDILIEEFRNSRRPLLQLYGNELKKSRHELLGQYAPLGVRGSVPSHELLLDYHHECSHRKATIFSEICAAVAPSQNVETTNRIAGLWPRITPRSLLRQLAQDRINTLPYVWRLIITHYAISLLKYRHSIRLLELSSRQQREELLREFEAIYNDVLSESTPDWLLMQVCRSC